MATVYQLNQLPCKTLSLVPPRQQLKANVLVSYSGFGLRLVEGPKLSIRELNLTRQLFRVQAASDEEWGPEKDEPVGESLGGSPVAVAEEQPDMPYDSAEISKLKKALVDSFYGTDRGLTVSIEMRADIVELITQLEARNPTPVPTEALALLNGKWILAYTSFSGLFPFLSRGTLPLVKVEEISQTIDSENFTVQFAGLRLQLPPMENLKFEVPNAFRLSL